MIKITFLGSSYSVPDENHENTHLVISQESQAVLVDCANAPLLRLRKAGVPMENLTDLILTHFHPDHVSGVPLLLMDLWLLGRRRPLNVYALDYTLERVKGMMDLYNWQRWPEFFPVSFHCIPDDEMAPVIERNGLCIYTSPVKHLIPTLGLRIEASRSGQTLAYSCDTEPCEAVVRLADRAQILVHEATGATPGHSSATQAGDIASRACVEALYLVHYNPQGASQLVDEAKAVFPGNVTLMEDFMTFDLA
ncbi:MAG: MBL fold metallo-hydrolase [Chloroflexi bacterium]|nr:MBL fold metallo-hydrolase [Chloroflexota bacterium]